MHRREWVSAHIFYHDSLDTLLTGAVRPLMESLRARGSIEGSFFIRYWQAGPHVRLRLLPRPGIEAATIRDALDETVGGFLRSHPSRTRIREEDYLRAAGPLARAEPGRAAIEPLQPNNSVRYLPYDPEYARYGGSAESMEVAERHFAESSAIALDVIASGGSRERRMGQALAMMFVCASLACDGDLGRLRRFVDVGRGGWGRRLTLGRIDRQEARFEERFQRQRERLRGLVGRLDAVARPGGVEVTDAPLARWADSVRTLRDRLQRLERDALFAPRELLFTREQASRGGASAGLESVLLLCSHMHNNRLGISLNDEAYLMYLLWRTVTDIADER